MPVGLKGPPLCGNQKLPKTLNLNNKRDKMGLSLGSGVPAAKINVELRLELRFELRFEIFVGSIFATPLQRNIHFWKPVRERTGSAFERPRVSLLAV